MKLKATLLSSVLLVSFSLCAMEEPGEFEMYSKIFSGLNSLEQSRFMTDLCNDQFVCDEVGIRQFLKIAAEHGSIFAQESSKNTLYGDNGTRLVRKVYLEMAIKGCNYDKVDYFLNVVELDKVAREMLLDDIFDTVDIKNPSINGFRKIALRILKDNYECIKVSNYKKAEIFFGGLSLKAALNDHTLLSSAFSEYKRSLTLESLKIQPSFDNFFLATNSVLEFHKRKTKDMPQENESGEDREPSVEEEGDTTEPEESASLLTHARTTSGWYRIYQGTEQRSEGEESAGPYVSEEDVASTHSSSQEIPFQEDAGADLVNGVSGDESSYDGEEEEGEKPPMNEYLYSDDSGSDEDGNTTLLTVVRNLWSMTGK
jgi:hypothetical protein